ncbi:MAG: hypothetical protein NTW52_07035 [Planctomycetota bacterium]|nr:hypothetical protein [Planctomycetota bacterium]
MPRNIPHQNSKQLAIAAVVCSVIVLVGAAGQPQPAFGQDSQSTAALDAREPDPAAIQSWIRDLGSPSTDLREAAADHLYRSGSLALPLVKRSVTESDEPEVRARCASLAIAIENDDLGKRVDQFLRESDPNKTYGLDNWPSFSEIVGPGRLSKRLFKEMIEAHPSFAEDDFADNDILLNKTGKVGREVLGRNDVLLTQTEKLGRDVLTALRSGEETRLGDVVTLMFASVQLSKRNMNVPRDIELTTSTLTRRTPFPQEVQGTALGTPLKALFREWMKTATSEPQMIMITCMELGLEEGKDVAKKHLADKNVGPDLFEISMACMMRFAATEDLPSIEPWTTDDRGLTPVFPVSTNTSMRQIPAPFGVPRIEAIDPQSPITPKIEDVQAQYRDLALAAGLKALSEDVTKYYPRAQWHPYRGFAATTLALPVADNSKRDAVLARWKELVELNAKPLPSAGESDTPALTPPVEIKN